MGCCDITKKNATYLIYAKSLNITMPSRVDLDFTRENIERITQYLEIEDSLKLLYLNSKIRQLLPEYVNLVEVLSHLGNENRNELDINVLYKDIWK